MVFHIKETMRGQFLNIYAEFLSSDVALVITFINRYRAKVTEMGLMESQIYIVDETGLFFVAYETSTFEKSASEHKIQNFSHT